MIAGGDGSRFLSAAGLAEADLLTRTP